jgi:phosphoribosyl-dephospho-CoA transferase
VNDTARHDLAWLDPSRLGAMEVDAAHRGELARWIRCGWPAVVTRRPPGADAGAVWLGLPLPPSRGRLRIALRAPAGAILRSRKPLELAEALAAVAPDRRAALEALDEEARGLGLTPRVHGSLAWQRLTGEAYTTASSDLDLLLAVESRRQLGAALRMLLLWERRSGLRADAELRLPAGGVSWRELASGARRVLVKGEADVVLLSADLLMAGLPEGCRP